MSIEEFKVKLQEIEQAAEQSKRRLITQYCREYARFKAGDTVEDHKQYKRHRQRKRMKDLLGQ